MLDDLEPLIEATMAEWQVPGLAIAVVHRDEPPMVRAFGQRDADTGLPVTTETQFLLCSITKSFTATGLAMLADEHRLDWHRPVREYLPEFRLRDPVASERTTVFDLLTHRTGLPRHDWLWTPGDFSPERVLAALPHLEPSRDFRQAYQYSNLGYWIAGMVAERITGMPWQEFMRDRVLVPLGMHRCGFSAADLERTADSARPHTMDGDRCRRAAFFPIAATPAGGLNAAIGDMAEYLRFHLADGSFGGARLLSADHARLLRSPHVYTGRSEFDEIGDVHYGLGFACYVYRGERAVTHDGGWIGWGTRLDMLPDHGLGVVVLTNRAPSPVTGILTHAVFDRLRGMEPVPWLERFRERRRQDRARDDGAARAAARRPGTRPSHALAEYAGDYDHPGYGRIAVEADDHGLRWRFRGLSGPLTHRHYDVFETPPLPDALEPYPLPISFGYDNEGTIDRLTAPFEPMVPDIVFRRRPMGEVLDPAFRAACVGTYRSGAHLHIVALEADGN